MRSFILAVFAFVAGFVVAWSAAMIVYIAGTEARFWQDRDGGLAMGFAFTIGPFFGVICGIAAVIWMVRRARRRALARSTAGSPH